MKEGKDELDVLDSEFTLTAISIKEKNKFEESFFALNKQKETRRDRRIYNL